MEKQYASAENVFNSNASDRDQHTHIAVLQAKYAYLKKRHSTIETKVNTRENEHIARIHE